MPKTFKRLYPRIYAFGNLYQAFRDARRGGKRKKESVAAFELDLEANLWQLHEELRTQTYRPSPYHNFYVQERKRRLISAAPFRDRVVHHALCRVVQPIFERRFITDSYACRVGKGTHRAVDRAQAFACRRGYVLQCDIQLRCHCYLRYCDDFLLFHNDKAQLWAWREAIIEFLTTLRLRLHEKRAGVFPTRTGITWLGYRVFPHYRLLRKDNVKRFRRRLHHMRDEYLAGRIGAEQMQASIRSWIAHASHAHTYHLRQRIFSDVTFPHPDSGGG